MHYFVDMYDDKMTFINHISDETCRKVLDASDSAKEILEFYTLGKGVKDALDELILWSSKANRSGNHIMRNLHTAEDLVRGFLFEFRTCLDHMETAIKREHHEDSQLWTLFKAGTANAYDRHPEYAFTYHLRNCSQHCKNVVHGFNCATGIGVSSNTQKLLTEFSRWNQADKDFMAAAGNEIDLLDTFSKAFSAFDSALKPVMQYLLDTNDVGKNLQYLRGWGDALSAQFMHDVHCFHIMNIKFQDGTDATREDMATGDVKLNAYPIDWKAIYELTDSLVSVQSADV